VENNFDQNIKVAHVFNFFDIPFWGVGNILWDVLVRM
jgi:hypothetical protein